MQTKREQVRAHTFQAQRLVRGVLLAEPEHHEQPFSRSATGTLVGILLSLVLLAGFAVYGLLRPGAGPALAGTTNLVIEKETGTRFVVDGGRLRPVANLASALLLAGPQPQTQTLTRRRTRLLPRAPAIGIVGAPDDVPRPDGLTTSGWSVCIGATTGTTGLAPTTLISFGPQPGLRELAPGQGFLVAAADGTLYLVADGTRYRITTTQARNALGYAATAPLRAGAAWLAALRPGRDVSTLMVDGAGRPGPVDESTVVGQVLAVHRPAGTQYFLVQRQEVVPVTEFEALLLLGNPKLSFVYPSGAGPVVVPEQDIAEATRAVLPDSLGWPAAPVAPVGGNSGSVCVVAGPDGVPRLATATTVTSDDTTQAPRSGATVVRVPPGSGVLVDETNATGGSKGGVWFVDSLGRRSAVAGGDALGALGFQGARRVKAPTALLGAIPAGPALDIAAAGRPVTPVGAAKPSASVAPG